MTELQDAICDRLVAAHISTGWVDGPLHVAAQVLKPGLQLAAARDDGPRQLVRILHWPRLFCYAFHGANAALSQEEDRRALAISLFRQLAPRTEQKRIPTRRACELVIVLAVRAHSQVCSAVCPLHQAMSLLAREFQGGGQPTTQTVRACEEVLGSCPNHTGSPREPVKLSSPPIHHSVVAYRYCCVALSGSMVAVACGDAVREAVKTETKLRGVPGGVEICLEVAAQLGL